MTEVHAVEHVIDDARRSGALGHGGAAGERLRCAGTIGPATPGSARRLAAAGGAPRFRLFIDRVQAGFADAARRGDRAALEAWKMAGDLARAEDSLNIDKRSIVLRLLERYAALF